MASYYYPHDRLDDLYPSRPNQKRKKPHRRFSKTEPASDYATALGYITQIYPDAISYSAPQSVLGLHGLSIFYVIFMFAITVLGLWEMQNEAWGWIALIAIMSIPVTIAMIILTIYFDFYQLEDQPVIFDRKNRKMYSVSGAKGGKFKRANTMVHAYEWDLVTASHNVYVETSSVGVKRSHELVFTAQKNANDTTMIGEISIGSRLVHSEETVAMMYEHIRRFMEENGPHLPPQEELTPLNRFETSLKQRLLDMTPFSPFYYKSWRTDTFLMILGHLFLPIYMIARTILAVGGWYVLKTRVKVEWPPQLFELLSQPLPHQPNDNKPS